MRSSTSSFNTIYLKTLLAILIGMGAALGLVRGFAIVNDASTESILGRVMEARDALPKIVQEEKDLVMVFGSSMVRAGFSPRQFDKEMQAQGIDVKSFNFGFGGLNPFFQDFLSRRVKEAFDANNRRLKLAIIEFNPFQTTLTRHRRAKSLEDSFLTMLGTEKELREVLLQDPTRGVRLYNIRYLRDSISAEMVTNFLGGSLRTPRQRTEIEENQELREKMQEIGQKLNEAFEKEYPDYVSSQWSYEWQGGGTIPEERSAETLALFEEFYANQNADQRRLDDDRLNRIHSADIIDLNFSQELIDAFIRIVKNFQGFSDQVEIVLLPRNTDWIENSPEGLARLQDAIQQIEAGTGIRIKNHQDLPSMKSHMFSDTTHLNRYQGAFSYTRHLVEEMSRLIN
ncbi:hypothetical protein [Marinicella sp. W31]|uniref:hypothetical protein n=1 Tax=Marinicella sp. W31 TaxID=3023713 RepID=UPI00375670DF